MRVHLEETRHHRAFGSIDDTAAMLRLRMRHDLADAVAFDHDVDVPLQRFRAAIEQLSSVDDERAFGKLTPPLELMGNVLDATALQIEPLQTMRRHVYEAS